VKSLGISVECPHCGVTRCGADLAHEYHTLLCRTPRG
jgi:hypothetical protein